MTGILGGLGIGLSKALSDAQRKREDRDKQINQLLLSGFERTREPQGGGIGNFFQELLAPQGLNAEEFSKPFQPEQFTLSEGEQRFQTQEGGLPEVIASGPEPVVTPRPPRTQPVKLPDGRLAIMNIETGEIIREFDAKKEVDEGEIIEQKMPDGSIRATWVRIGVDAFGKQRLETHVIPELSAEAAPEKPRSVTEILSDMTNLSKAISEGTINEDEATGSLEALSLSLESELFARTDPEQLAALEAKILEIANKPTTPEFLQQMAIDVLTKMASLATPIPIEEVEDREQFGTVSVD